MVCLAPLASGQTLWKILKTAEAATKVYQATTITDQELANYMRQSMAIEDTKHKVCSSSNAYTVRLLKITKNMTGVNGLRLNFKVYYDTQTANAFASPDGSIRVYSKLMDIMTDAEILGVLSHELGHVACSHSKKAYRQQLLVSAARDGLMLNDGTIGDIAYSSLGSMGEYMVAMKFSRTQESEADNFAYNYLKKIGSKPTNMILALDKLRQNSGSGSSNKYARYLTTMVSSHPDLTSRIEALCAKAKKDGYSCVLCK